MRRHTSLLTLPLLAMFAGLGCDNGAPLAAFKDAPLKVILDDDTVNPISSSPDKLSFSVNFDYDRATECRRLTDATTATLDGVPLYVGTGGHMRTLAKEEEPNCWEVFVYQALDRSTFKGGDGHLVISDGDTTFSVDVKGLLDPHQWNPKQSLDAVHAGQEVAFDWSVPTDQVSFFGAIFDSDLQAGFNESVDARLDANALLVRVRDHVAPGPQSLFVSAHTQTPVTRCDGPASCEATVMSAREYPMRVE